MTNQTNFCIVSGQDDGMYIHWQVEYVFDNKAERDSVLDDLTAGYGDGYDYEGVEGAHAMGDIVGRSPSPLDF